MSDGALRIPITGDASQFKATLSEVESSLKYFREKLKSAKGDQIGKINFTISGLEETKNALTTFGKFAEGTLGQLYQKLDQLKTLRLTIQADATALTPVNNAIDETTKKIKDLLNAGLQKPIVEAAQVSANSIQGLKNRIDELNQKKLNLDAKDDYLQIVKLNQEIDKLKTQITNLNKLGLKVDQTIDPAVNSFKNLTNTSNKSRQALTSLSLVAQDLPFGFIAIQNNLPAVISSFGALRASSNGVRGTLAALGAGLVGPAGLFLAFSVVTGAITYAIQKYGSLGAAVKEFLGTTTKLDIVLKKSTESLDKYNKELETTEEITGRGKANASGEIIRIQTLSSAVRDVTLSEQQRANALKELQKLDPENLKNIDLQRDGYGYLDKFVKQYTDSLIANAVAQEYLSKVVATTTQINQQSLALQEIAKGYADIAQRRRQAEAQPQFDPATGADLTTTILGGLEVAQKNLNKRFFEQAKIVSTLYGELNTYKSSLQQATIETLNFFKGTGGASGDKNVFAPKIDSQDLDEAFNLDKIIGNLTTYGNVLIDVNKSEEERKNALRELKEINSEYFQSFTTQKSLVGQYKIKLEDLIKTFKIEKKEREDLLRISKLNEDFRKNEEKGIKSLGDKYNIFADQKSSFPETFEDIQKAYEGNTKQGESLFKNLISDKADVKRATEPLAELQRQFQLAYTAINQTFFEPLQNLFETFLNTGKFTFKEFTKSVLKSITSIVSKLAATGVITALMYLLDPSGMLASFGGSFGGGQGGGNGILSALGSVFGAQPRKPDFNGVRPQGGGRGGEKVEFQIRGTNLVGVLNRANGEINRIG